MSLLFEMIPAVEKQTCFMIFFDLQIKLLIKKTMQIYCEHEKKYAKSQLLYYVHTTLPGHRLLGIGK